MQCLPKNEELGFMGSFLCPQHGPFGRTVANKRGLAFRKGSVEVAVGPLSTKLSSARRSDHHIGNDKTMFAASCL